MTVASGSWLVAHWVDFGSPGCLGSIEGDGIVGRRIQTDNGFQKCAVLVAGVTDPEDDPSIEYHRLS